MTKSIDQLELEDRVNSLTHAVGTGIALSGLALILVLAIQTNDPWKIVSSCVYGFTLVLLFASSMLYHSVRDPKRRRRFRVLDHVSINLLIAGTYTPFLLVNLRGPWGWWLFGAIWGLASLGAGADLLFAGKAKSLSTVVYILMGWIILIALKPLVQVLPPLGVILLFAGGGVYTLGAIFYLLDKKLPLGHAVWHLFVLGGCLCHFLAIVLEVLPYHP